MINVIVELSKYLILTLMIIYTFHCFYTVRQQDEIERNELLRQQMVLIFFMDFTAFLVIYLKTFNFQVIVFYVEMMVFFAAVQILYRIFYKKASLLLLNNMCMLLSVGFIMLCRLDIATATKQLVIAAAASGDLFCRLSCNALCFHKKASVSGTWTGGGKPWGSGGILPFRSCAPESQRMERSDGCLSERGLSDRPVTVCHRNRRLVRHGTLPGFAGVYSGCKK